MKVKLVGLIITLSLLFFFGFKIISVHKKEVQSTNIEQLNILNYLPEDNKLLFISNFDSSNIINNIKNNSNPTNKNNFVLIENSILDYLGIDLGNNKLEDIYDNELLISTFENKKKLKDDILIVFKIKPEKNLDDILHLSNEIDQLNEIIPIYRREKLNYLNYIYRTEDNYIIASSNKKLILNCIKSSDNLKDKKNQYEREIAGLKEQNNILFTKTFGKSIFFNDRIFPNSNEYIIASTFTLKDKHLILKSYLLNNKKNLDIIYYDNLINKDPKNKDNTQVSIFSDFKSFAKYLKPLINDFENSLFEELNQKMSQNILILNSNKDWIITFEKDTQIPLDLNSIKKLKDFNKYTLKKNENIYSIYSRNILEEKNDVIKQLTYEDIYSVESEGLFIISNNLIDGKKQDLISKKFLNLKTNKDKSAFIYAKVNIKDKNSKKIDNFSYLEDLNLLLRKIIKISNEEFLEIVKQSIPEKNPIIYTENSFKIIE